jgi:hypothetical protein
MFEAGTNVARYLIADKVNLPVERRREIETELNYLVSLVALTALILSLVSYTDGLRRLRYKRG